MKKTTRRVILQNAASIVAVAGLAGQESTASKSVESVTPSLVDHHVTTLDQLQSVFGGGLESGDTVVIDENEAGGPYRTRSHLDIDVSDVTVIGRGPVPLIMPKDGSNVGGFRVGYDRPVSGIMLRGLSYDCHPETHSENRGGFGIGVFTAEDTRIQNCTIRRTWPYHEHNQMNSGIMVFGEAFEGGGATSTSITNCRFEEVGDRAITTAGKGNYIAGNFSRNGFDRMVSASSALGDSSETIIEGNVLYDNRQGSMIGWGGGANARRVIVQGNIALGRHRCLVTLQNRGEGVVSDFIVQNNIGINDSPPDPVVSRAGIHISAGKARIAGNTLIGYPSHGIDVHGYESEITQNRIEMCAGAGINLGDGSNRSVVHSNSLKNNATEMARPEIDVATHRATIKGNVIHAMQNAIAGFRTKEGSGRNIYQDNRVPGDHERGETPVFALLDSYDTVLGMSPRFDTHQNLSPKNGQVQIDFDKPYITPPELTYGRRGGGIQHIEYLTSEHGHYVGARVYTEADSPLDVFVNAGYR